MASIDLWPGIAAADLWPGRRVRPRNWAKLVDNEIARRAAKLQLLIKHCAILCSSCKLLGPQLGLPVPNDPSPIIVLPYQQNLKTWQKAHKLPAHRRNRLPRMVQEHVDSFDEMYEKNDMATILGLLFPRHGQKRKADSDSDWDNTSDSDSDSSSERDGDSD